MNNIKPGCIIKLTEQGVARVLKGKADMLFPVVETTSRANGETLAHVGDFRYGEEKFGGYQIWTLAPEDYTFYSAQTRSMIPTSKEKFNDEETRDGSSKA